METVEYNLIPGSIERDGNILTMGVATPDYSDMKYIRGHLPTLVQEYGDKPILSVMNVELKKINSGIDSIMQVVVIR